MTPYEIMLSESQERMLLVARRDRLGRVFEIFRKWDLEAAEIGTVTNSGRVVLFFEGKVVADLPAEPLSSEAPLYDRPRAAPAPRPAPSWPDEPEPSDYGDCLRRILAGPNVAEKSWIWTQYDHMVGTNTVERPGGDAARGADQGDHEGPGPQERRQSRSSALSTPTGARRSPSRRRRARSRASGRARSRSPTA